MSDRGINQYAGRQQTDEHVHSPGGHQQDGKAACGTEGHMCKPHIASRTNSQNTQGVCATQQQKHKYYDENNGQRTNNRCFSKEGIQRTDKYKQRRPALVTIRGMQINHIMSPHTVKMTITKTTRDSKCWWRRGEVGSRVHCRWVWNWCSQCGKQDGGPSKLRNRAAYDSDSDPLLSL